MNEVFETSLKAAKDVTKKITKVAAENKKMTAIVVGCSIATTAVVITAAVAITKKLRKDKFIVMGMPMYGADGYGYFCSTKDDCHECNADNEEGCQCGDKCKCNK